MDQNNYNVDDILEEIKRKKSRRDTGGAPAVSAPLSDTSRRQQDRAAVQRESWTASSERGYDRPPRGERTEEISAPSRENFGQRSPFERVQSQSGGLEFGIHSHQDDGRILHRESAKGSDADESLQSPSPRPKGFAEEDAAFPHFPLDFDTVPQGSGREEPRPGRRAPVSEEPLAHVGGALTARDFGIPTAVEQEEPQTDFRDRFRWGEEEDRAQESPKRGGKPWEESLPPPQLFDRENTKHNLLKGLGEERFPQSEEEFEESFNRARAAKGFAGLSQEPETGRTQLHPPLSGQEHAQMEDPEEVSVASTRMSILIPQEDLEENFPEETGGSRFSFGKGKSANQKRSKREKGSKESALPFQDELEDDTPPEVDDFNSPEDIDTVTKDLRKSKNGLLFRLVITLLGFGALTYLSFAQVNLSFPLLAMMTPEKNMRMFLGVNLAILLLLTLVCNTTVGGGLVSLFTLKPDSDTPVALAVLAAVAQGVVLVVYPEAMGTVGVHYYFAVVALALVFNTIGKLYMIHRIEGNFKILAGTSFDKYAVMTVKNKDLAHELTRGQNLDDPVVAYSCQAGFVTNFLELSYTEDYGENIARITTPLFLFFSLLASAGAYFLFRDVFVTLSAFSAMLCVCAPFTTTIVGNLPLFRMAGKLSRHGSMVAGYTALDHFDDVNGLLVDETEIFPRGTIILHGIKSFDQKRVDEAILDAASVICKSNGALKDIFMEMIGARENILKEVDGLIYEDGMGLSAWVGGKRVLIGNRELMRNHSVDTPSRDYEKKFVRDGREILYLSNSGELTAMFILSYTASADIADELAGLADRGVVLIVHTSDPNLTPRKIGEVFGYSADMINIVPAKLQEDYDRMTAPRPRAKAEMVYTGSILSKIYSMKAVLTAKGAIVLGTVLQGLGMVLGYGIIAFFAFTGAMGALSFSLLLIYQLLWTALVMLLPNLRRY